MFLVWGPELTFLYNEAYQPLLGLRKTNVLGMPIHAVWPEIWDTLAPVVHDAMAGKSSHIEDIEMNLEHDGKREERYFNYTFSPIQDENESVQGFQCICSDSSKKVEAERVAARSEAALDKARAELARERQTEALRLLTDSMPQIIWTARPDGFVDYYNARWHEYTGLAAGDHDWNDPVHPDDRDHVAETWQKAISSGDDYRVEARLRGADGAYRWFRGHAVPVRAPSGEIIKWYGTNTNIDEFKTLALKLQEAHQAIETEKNKFEAIFASAASPMALLREPGHVFEKANNRFINAFPNRVIIGMPVADNFPELVDQGVIHHLDEVVRTGVPYSAQEVRRLLNDRPGGPAREYFLDCSYVQIRDSQGKPYGTLVHLMDVTDRVVARRRLEENEDRLSVSVDAANLGIWTFDPETETVALGVRSARMFGLPGTKVLTQDEILERIHPDDRIYFQEALKNALNPGMGGIDDLRYRILLPDGEIRWISIFGRTRFHQGSDAPAALRFSGAMLDITREILAHHELIDARRAAEEANSAKSAFLANMSHEIRSPLGAVMGFVELLKDPSLSQADIREYIGVIERNSSQLLRLIDDILDLSKVEAGKMLIEHIDFSLLELLSDFSSLMGFKARDNGIDFRVHAETAIPDPLTSDPTRIRQILNNIVSNAIKFTKKGFVDLSVRYDAGFLEFKITDSGRGISPEQAQSLFQPFTQADASTTRSFGGTGLGLVLTRKLAEAMGGSFRLLESEIGKGSVFVAKIAIGAPNDSRLIRSSQFRYTTEPVASYRMDSDLLEGKRILVVEDSPDNQMLLRVILTRCGAKVDIAADGFSGVEKALESTYDIVLMDVQMPRMDGYEAVETLRSKRYRTPIIALTAHAMKEERDRCLSVGYSDFLSKPIDRSLLVEMILRATQRPFEGSHAPH